MSARIYAEELQDIATRASSLIESNDFWLPKLVQVIAGVVAEASGRLALDRPDAQSASFRAKAAMMRNEAAGLLYQAMRLLRDAQDYESRVT